jgi:catechol 2,3-dioxygenase-like lactoylglutathione lyase family enzyme
MMKFKFLCTRLYVCNYEACLQFYRDILGFETTFVSEYDGCAELNTGETKLTLLKRHNLEEMLERANLVSGTKSNDGIVLSFTVNNLNEVYKQLKAQGVAFINHEPWNFPDWGFLSIFCRDPDGNIIEIQQLLS